MSSGGGNNNQDNQRKIKNKSPHSNTSDNGPTV